MYKHEKNSGREEKLILANPILADPHYPVRHAPSKFSAFIIFSRSKTTFPFKNQVICFFVVEVFPFRVSITHLVGAVFVGNVATSPPGGGEGRALIFRYFPQPHITIERRAAKPRDASYV